MRLVGVAGVVCVFGLVAASLGCMSPSIPDPQQRLRIAQEIAANSGLMRLETESTQRNPLPVAVWIRHPPNRESAASNLHIYIEGDGLGWRGRRRVSLDPTPLHPTAMELAAADPSRATIVYLGRPCQYGFPQDSACRPIFWTAARHGEAVVDAMDRRIDTLITKLDHRGPLTLIGYSGGGVIAALLAARRNDIELLVTIAAPLDLDGWTRAAHVSRLAASLSPMDELEALRSVRQHHFVGRDDVRVPIAATENFHRKLGRDAPSRLTTVEGMDHHSWPEAWKTLVETSGLFE